MNHAIAIHATPLRTPELNLFDASAASCCARHLADSYQRYRTQSRQFTRQAALHFQHCDWSAAQMDATESGGLFDRFAQAAADRLVDPMSPSFWCAVNLQYEALLTGDHDPLSARLFFARIRALRQIPAPTDSAIFLLPLDAHHAELHYSPCDQPLLNTLMPLLSGMSLEAEWQDLASSAEQIAAVLQATLHADGWNPQDIELLATVFYRGTRAYLIGCLHHQHGQLPIVIALRNDGEGARVDEIRVGATAAADLFRAGQQVLQADSTDFSAALGYVHALLPDVSFAQLMRSVGWHTSNANMPCN